MRFYMAAGAGESFMHGVQARSQGGANKCNCTPPLDARSTWQAMNIIHLIVYCSAIYTYLDDNCQLSACTCILCTYACKSTGTIQM